MTILFSKLIHPKLFFIMIQLMRNQFLEMLIIIKKFKLKRIIEIIMTKMNLMVL